jgi:superfamily II DNA/RNA helicase
MSFASLGLSEPLLRAIAEQEYRAPTPVQSAAIPAVLNGRAVLACAQTGSGKTAAFALPLLQRLVDHRAKAAATRDPWQKARTANATRALILVPTRELATQIATACETYARHLSSIKIVSVFGGVSINPQMMALRGGADIVVATPGRLLDLIEQNALRLGTVSTLVLDEADKLLELGFEAELSRIRDLLPPQRQSLLFSATFPAAVQLLAEQWLHDPVRIDVPATDATVPDIEQRAIEVDGPRRTQLLRHLIETLGWTRTLVFVATKHSTEHVAEKLRRAGINAAPFHGELSQGHRSHVLADFKASRLQVVVATDLAARGIDIVQLPVIVNYDLPRSADDYVHRIGRTGRAGEHGLAVSFVSAESEAHFRLIEKRQGLCVPRERISGFEPTNTTPPADAPAKSTGGIKGKRKSKKDKLREAAAKRPQD